MMLFRWLTTKRIIIIIIIIACLAIGSIFWFIFRKEVQNPDSSETYIAAAQFHSGQTKCWNTFGDVITCTGTGQDADVDGTSKSYTDNGCGTGTVLDNHTNLCWQKDDQDARTWEDALNYCNDLSLGGHSDWHLPTRLEGVTMLDYSCDSDSPAHCYGDFQNNALIWDSVGDNDTFWLSTTKPDNTSYAYRLNTNYGNIYALDKTILYYVRCVRGR